VSETEGSEIQKTIGCLGWIAIPPAVVAACWSISWLLAHWP
jgi:hypothetical protein